MFDVAHSDHERQVIESYALVALMRAARTYGLEFLDACSDDGLRSATFAVPGAVVTFSYPIWFAADGALVSWQMDVVRDQDPTPVAFLTGVLVDAPREALFHLLFTISDPLILDAACEAAHNGGDPAQILADGRIKRFGCRCTAACSSH